MGVGGIMTLDLENKQQFIIKIIIAILIIVIGGITFSVVMSYEPPVESHSIRLSNYSEWSAWNVINMSCEILVRYDNKSQNGGMARCYRVGLKGA